jgi:hypothetical protein
MITIARRIAAGTALAMAPAFIALGVAATSHAEMHTHTGPQHPHTVQTGPKHQLSGTTNLAAPAQPAVPAHHHHHYGS